jgi:hypothetical protein
MKPIKRIRKIEMRVNNMPFTNDAQGQIFEELLYIAQKSPELEKKVLEMLERVMPTPKEIKKKG